MNAEHLKQQAAEAALDYVKDGMKLGLGTGSTAVYFIKGLGEMVANGQIATNIAHKIVSMLFGTPSGDSDGYLSFSKKHIFRYLCSDSARDRPKWNAHFL